MARAGTTYWPVTVKAFSVDTKEHLVVGEDFESREDHHDCHWRFTVGLVLSMNSPPPGGPSAEPGLLLR